MLSRVLPGHSIFSNLSRVHSAIYFSRRAWIRPFVFTIFPRAFFPRRSSQSPEKARQILDRSKLSGKTEQRNTSENDEHRIPRIIPSGIREKKNERLAKSLDRNIVAVRFVDRFQGTNGTRGARRSIPFEQKYSRGDDFRGETRQTRGISSG